MTGLPLPPPPLPLPVGTDPASDVRSVSSFPLPPMQYVNKFRDDELPQGQTWDAPAPPPLNRPPPPLPTYSSYTMFGVPCNQEDQILRSLESQGVRRVYPQAYDHRRELKKLNFSVLANFLDLLDIITRDPSSPKRTEKLDHLNTLFINMHHLVNEYRPHQARDSLREMMRHQAEVTRQTAEMADLYLARAEVALERARSELPEQGELEGGLEALLVGVGMMVPDGGCEEEEDMMARGECSTEDVMEGCERLWLR